VRFSRKSREALLSDLATVERTQPLPGTLVAPKVGRPPFLPLVPQKKQSMSREPKVERAGFTLVEIMIVVAIIALLAAIVVPSFLRARKRSQATTVKNDLRLIDSAIAQYAMETNKQTADPIYVDDWLDYIKQDTNLYDTAQDLFGNDYGDQIVDSLPDVPASTYDTLSDVADSAFWLPYMRETTPHQKHKTKGRGHH
jgi:prepilin-type N-terminal cleavage/methylation domain-containing protein